MSCGHTNGSSMPLKGSINKNGDRTNLTRYLDEEKWNDLFPNRYGIGLKDSINNNPDFYSFKTFVSAAKYFLPFCQMVTGIHKERSLLLSLRILHRRQAGDGRRLQAGILNGGYIFWKKPEAKTIIIIHRTGIIRCSWKILLWQGT